MPTIDGVTAPHVIVLFGATGDLARRKLLPGLLRLTQAGLLKDARFVGTSLEEMDTGEFVELARRACSEFGKGELDDGKWERFAAMITYVSQTQGPHALADAVHKAEAELGVDGEVRLLHYLSVPPKAAGSSNTNTAAFPAPGSGYAGLLHAPPESPPHRRSTRSPRPKPL